MDFFRIFLLLALAGAAMTVVGSGYAYWNDEPRRLRRLLERALQAPPEMVIIAKGRGLAAGFNLDAGRVAVLWSDGVKGLIYRLDQLIGAELIVDDRVSARAFRGEPRRPLDEVSNEAKRVLLRLVFDNPRDPDFELPLWPPVDPDRPQKETAFDAIQAARRWVSSVESLVRKSAVAEALVQGREARAQALTPAAPPPPPPLLAAMEADEEPPWEDDPNDDDDEDRPLR